MWKALPQLHSYAPDQHFFSDNLGFAAWETYLNHKRLAKTRKGEQEVLAFCNGWLFFHPVSVRFFKFWLPVIIWIMVIFSASTGAGSPQNTSRFIGPILRFLHVPEQYHAEIHYCVRKTAHFVEYAVLGLLLWRALCAGSVPVKNQFWLALALCALYATSDEFHQSFVKGREASPRDVLIDSCGSAFGLAIYWSGRRWRKKA